ncbi:MAG: uL15 family ribosomal protein [Patescibacteria group bacterium]|jgi:large subunit ribosomal protein L15|nr:uL15 family ribosomal protein [Patescibacteria group bacterium]
MQLHELRKEYKTKKEKRVGRGGKRGTYSGRGLKGQKARAGAKIRPAIYDLIIKIPKKRGVKNKPLNEKPIAINLDILNKYFKEGDVVSPQTLFEKGLIEKKKGKLPKIKILGRGELKHKLIFKKCYFSQEAFKKVKIKK